MTQTVTTTRTPHYGSNVNRSTLQTQEYVPRNSGTPQDQGYAPRNNAAPQHQAYGSRNTITPQQEYGFKHDTSSPIQEYSLRNNAGTIRPVNDARGQGPSMTQSDRDNSLSSPRFNTYDSPNLPEEDHAGLVRQNSIPRKQIGTSPNTPYSSVQASSPHQVWSTPMAQTGHSRQQSAPKSLPSTPAAKSREFNDRQTDPTPQSSSILNRSRPTSSNPAGLRDAQDVVDRAKTNTCDTQVVESVAPGQSPTSSTTGT